MFGARFAAVLAVAAAFAATPALAQTVGIGTGPQGTPTNVTGAAIAKVVADGTNLQTRAVPHTSTDAAIPLVNRGRMEFGLPNLQQFVSAVEGTEEYEGRQQENLRIVARLYPLVIGLVARKDTRYRTVADIKGTRFPMGYTAQPTVQPQALAVLANGGLGSDDVRHVLVPNTTRGAEDFMQGRVDVWLGALGGARLRQVDASVGGIRILSLDPASEAVARLKQHFPTGYAHPVKAGTPGLDSEPTYALAFDFLIVGSTHSSDEVVYQVVKAMHGGKDAMITVSRSFEDFEPERMAAPYPGYQYHPGAIRFYREVGIWPAS